MTYYPKNVSQLSQEDYEEILEELKFLDRLREAGVDNWEGYHYAFDNEDEDEDDDWDD